MFSEGRIYGRTKVYSIEELRRLFLSKEFDFAKIVALFGSRARGDSGLRSDYDFAMLFDRRFDDGWGIKSKAFITIQDTFGFGDRDFDIVDIENADSLVKSSILENFIILKGSEDELRRVLTKK